jgi:ADP-ribosylglycohydrolase
MEGFEEQVQGGLFGVCIGDALGVPVEGASRVSLKKHPVRGFGHGTASKMIPVGWWSDDSSLTFCLAESLAEKGVDLGSIARKFCSWLYKGHWTPAGKAFGIGYTTALALERFRRGSEPKDAGGKDEYSNGNGSLMRILPIVFYIKGLKTESALGIVHDVSSITHAHKRSHIACGMYVLFALNLLEGLNREAAYRRLRTQINDFYRSTGYREELAHYKRILNDNIALLPEEEVRSSGYVVDTLEAALWCFLNGTSFSETVLYAVNLGGDSDTTGAVAGGLAGIYYGFNKIPKEWIETVVRRDDIVRLGKRLIQSIS